LLYLILAVFISLVVSFACSIMEATLLSVSRSYVQKLVNEGKRSGLILQEFKKNIDEPLAAILALNTAAATIGATVSGAQAQKLFSGQWVGAFALVFTLAILVLSEIIPKTLGVVYWRKTAPATAYLLKGMVFVFSPFIFLSRIITGTFASKGLASPQVMREELLMMAEVGEDHGALSDWEEKVIKNILLLDRIKVREIFTPRTVMLAFPMEMTVAQVQGKYPSIPFSRIPLYGEHQDDIQGMVLRQDSIEAAARDRLQEKLFTFMRPLSHVPESLSIARAIESFIKRREHMFVVIDEYGGTEGIVTLEDAMESLLGTEIVDEKDRVIDMRELALRLWRSRRRMEAASQARQDPGKEEESPPG
jgi:CBS domain containing-hemolysin-like protein